MPRSARRLVCRPIGLMFLLLLASACATRPASEAAQPAPSAAGGAAPAPAASTGPTAASPAASEPFATLVPLPQHVVISYSSVAGSFLPLWLAADEGLFAKHGLDAEVVYIGSGTTSMQSLIAGDVQFILTSGAEPAAAYVAGAPVQMVIAWD